MADGNSPVKPTNVTKRQLDVVEAFRRYVQERANIEGGLAKDDLSSEQMSRIMAARTEEELEAAMEIVGLRGLREIPNGTIIEIKGFHLVPGTRDEFQNSLKVFAVLDVTMLSKTREFGEIGERYSFDTGVERIIAWLRAVESGQIPGLSFPVSRLLTKKEGGRGDMITLKRLPTMPVKAEAEKP